MTQKQVDRVKQKNAPRAGPEVEQGGKGRAVQPRSPEDAWLSTPSSKSLSGRASRDTVPEILLRRALHRLGLRYRLHTRIGQRLTLDIDFTRKRLGVFVDGCYWHGGCPVHPRTPPRGPNAAAWLAKFASIAEREIRAAALLEARGYTVLRLRECEIRAAPDLAAHRVAGILAAAGGSPRSLRSGAPEF
jgi:DNA mismatch endonuclease (patch repair protein)